MASLTLGSTGEVSRQLPAPTDILEQRNAKEVPNLGSVNAIRAEVDAMQHVAKSFHEMPPDDVFSYCSGFCARLIEIQTRIYRIEGRLPHWAEVRRHEIEPTLKDLRWQYDVASRRLSSMEHEYKVQRGVT